MDLSEEILSVLDNPAEVWSAIINNFAQETRVSLLTFATCSGRSGTPLLAWQLAVARADPTAAPYFDQSLQVLDDLFVTLTKSRSGDFEAAFRNPSMDDFCALQLDRHVGFLANVLKRDPSLAQITRVVELSTARASDGTRAFAHPNMHAAFIAQPGTVMSNLWRMMEQGVTAGMYPQAELLLSLRTVAAGDSTRVATGDADRLRDVGRKVLMNFGAGTREEWRLPAAYFDAPRVARLLPWVLQSDFQAFYERLCGAAVTFDHYECLVNFDTALGRGADEATWADEYLNTSAQALADAENDTSLSVDDLAAQRDSHAKISEFLGYVVDSLGDDWDGLVQRAEEAAVGEGEEIPFEKYQEWRSAMGGEREDRRSALGQERARVNALFSSLVDDGKASASSE